VSGLNAGVTLATSGFDRLENGAHVLARNPKQTSPQQNTQGHGSTPGPGGSTAP